MTNPDQNPQTNDNQAPVPPTETKPESRAPLWFAGVGILAGGLGLLLLAVTHFADVRSTAKIVYVDRPVVEYVDRARKVFVNVCRKGSQTWKITGENIAVSRQ